MSRLNTDENPLAIPTFEENQQGSQRVGCPKLVTQLFLEPVLSPADSRVSTDSGPVSASEGSDHSPKQGLFSIAQPRTRDEMAYANAFGITHGGTSVELARHMGPRVPLKPAEPTEPVHSVGFFAKIHKEVARLREGRNLHGTLDELLHIGLTPDKSP